MRTYRRELYRQSARKRFAFRLRLVLLVLLCGVGIFFFTKTASMQTTYTRLTSWIAAYRKHSNDPKQLTRHEVARKVLAKQKTTEPDIQFEFYTALPNMKVESGSR